MVRTPVALVGAVAAVIAATCGLTQQSPSVLWYRLSTSLTALHALLTLPPEHVQEFLKSYEIFDKEKITDNPEDAQNIINYYKVLNHLCAVGEVEKMYIPPAMDLNQSIFANQVLWEEKGMADQLNVGPGKKVLDVGCGRGRIAHHVASYTGADVTGINIDKSQIEFARKYADQTGKGDQLKFVEHNYNKPLPFEDNTFDALYHVQALTYAEDLGRLLKDMHRILKPGAKMSFLDWFQLDKYNASDAHHRKLLREVKAVIGAVKTPTPEEYKLALQAAGFELISSAEASVDGGHQYPLVLKADNFFQAMKSFVSFLARYSLVPKHLDVLLQRLTEGGESLIEADRKGLFTTSWQIIAQKPFATMVK